MKNLFIQIKDSIYNPDFYKSLSSKDTSYTIYYALKFSAVLSLIMAFALTFMFLVFVKNYGGEGLQNIYTYGETYLSENYKDGYTLSFEDNVLVSNSAEALVFPIPTEWKDSFTGTFDEDTNYKDLENLVVIDPSKNYSRDELENSKAIAFFAKDGGAVKDEQKGRVQMVDYSEPGIEELNGQTLTKENLLGYYKEGFDVLKSVMPYLYIFVFFGSLIGLFIFIFIGMLVFALWTGLIAFIIAKLLKKEGDYGSWYLVAIHADTLPVLVTYLLFPISISLSSITFLYTAFVVFMIYLNKFHK